MVRRDGAMSTTNENNAATITALQCVVSEQRVHGQGREQWWGSKRACGAGAKEGVVEEQEVSIDDTGGQVSDDSMWTLQCKRAHGNPSCLNVGSMLSFRLTLSAPR